MPQWQGFMEYPTVRPSPLFEPEGGGRVRCSLCNRRCTISPGGVGVCRTRMNVDGVLYTLVYGDLSALESRPIEMKPFFHYWPGSRALTFSTWSCNLDCAWCQNHDLSKVKPEPVRGTCISQETVLRLATKLGNEGLCASFQEPTLLTDWVLPLFGMAKGMGLYCCYVSNGYMTREALRLLREAGMDGLKVDVKGSDEVYERYCGGGDAGRVWRTVEEAKRLGIHVEVVNLMVTGVNDDEGSVGWLVDQHMKHAGAETPLHFNRYHPAYRFDRPPTEVKRLEAARLKAVREGALYVYVGNVPGHRYENTFCPGCGRTLILRSNCRIVEYNMTKDDRCPDCGRHVLMVGRYRGRGGG